MDVAATLNLMEWVVFYSGRATAACHMAADCRLLHQLGSTRDPLLHFYEWERRSATYGHFIRPEKIVSEEGVSRLGIELARRPTGGGMIFHECDLAFSLLIPATAPFFSANVLDSYAYVNRRVAAVVSHFLGGEREPILLGGDLGCQAKSCSSFCMGKPTRYDVMVGGKKVVGGAQRRTRSGLLHQLSICLTLPPDELLDQLLAKEVADAMRQNSFCLLGERASQGEIEEARQELRELLIAEIAC